MVDSSEELKKTAHEFSDTLTDNLYSLLVGLFVFGSCTKRNTSSKKNREQASNTPKQYDLFIIKMRWAAIIVILYHGVIQSIAHFTCTMFHLNRFQKLLSIWRILTHSCTTYQELTYTVAGKYLMNSSY